MSTATCRFGSPSTAARAKRAELLRRVDAKNLDDTIRIFTISFGASADRRLLGEIAERSKASAYNATKPQEIDKVFVSVFSNFAG